MIFMPGQVVCFRLPVDQFSVYLEKMTFPISLEHDSVMVRLSFQDPASKDGEAYIGRSMITYLKRVDIKTSEITGINMLSATATKQHWILLEFLPSPNGQYRVLWPGCHSSEQPKSFPRIRGRLGIETIQDGWYMKTNWYPSFQATYKHN